MPTTTTYLYKKPIDGERGFWTHLNYNTQRLNDHGHDGVDSKKLPPTAITKNIQTIPAVNWVATSGGLYEQTISLSAGYAFSTGLSIKFFISGGGEDGSELVMTPVKVTDTSMKLEINDNTLTLNAVYA